MYGEQGLLTGALRRQAACTHRGAHLASHGPHVWVTAMQLNRQGRVSARTVAQLGTIAAGCARLGVVDEINQEEWDCRNPVPQLGSFETLRQSL